MKLIRDICMPDISAEIAPYTNFRPAAALEIDERQIRLVTMTHRENCLRVCYEVKRNAGAG